MSARRPRRTPAWTDARELKRTRTRIARIRKQLEEIAYAWWENIDLISEDANRLGRDLDEFESSLDEIVREVLAERKAEEERWS